MVTAVNESETQIPSEPELAEVPGDARDDDEDYTLPFTD